MKNAHNTEAQSQHAAWTTIPRQAETSVEPSEARGPRCARPKALDGLPIKFSMQIALRTLKKCPVLGHMNGYCSLMHFKSLQMSRKLDWETIAPPISFRATREEQRADE